MGKTDLLSLLPEEAQRFLVENGEQKYREKQIFSWLMKGKSFENMQNLPIKTREMLAEQCLAPLPTVEAKQISKIDGTVKYLFRLHDGNMVESVLMKYEYGNSLCISSQVGCRMGCRFCASTLSGKARDLLPSELLGQIIVAQSDSGCHVSHVVLMGIGEPLDNYDNVVKFLRLAAHPERLGLSPRRVSLSTWHKAIETNLLLFTQSVVVCRLFGVACQLFPLRKIGGVVFITQRAICGIRQ